MSLTEQIRKSIEQRKLLRSGERVVVAVSGGLDSMVLLQLLHELSGTFGWNLVVAHFNHQLRGRSSDADERFVRKTAEELGLPIQVGRGNVKGLAKREGISIEMAARRLRHRFLAATARRRKCRTIAVAHHADDQVELFFLRLLRGAGSDGLAGMKWVSVSPADSRVRVMRPLLGVSKQVLVQFARNEGVHFREDASNASQDILRNRVRHELLPLLRRSFQPALDRRILRLMDLLGAESEVVGKVVQSFFRGGNQSRRMARWPVAVQRRVIQLQLQGLKVEPNFELVEQLRGAIGEPVTVSPQLRVVCDVNGRVRPALSEGTRFRKQRKSIFFRQAVGDLTFAGTTIHWQRQVMRGDLPTARVPGEEHFDADRVGARIVLRHWQPGDRFQPIGMAVAVKLQDWFTNRKIPAARRRELLVATTARGEIFWVEGQRIGERFKLTPQTRRRLLWRWRATQTT